MDVGVVEAQGFAVQVCIGDGNGVVGTDFARQGGDGLLPVELGFGFTQFVCVGNALCGLRRGDAGLREDVGQGAQEGVSTELHEAVMQGGGGVVRSDGEAAFLPDGASVQAFVHLHDADAGFFVARFDSALDGGGPPPARQ